MNNFLPKLKKRYRLMASTWKVDCVFSRKYAWYRVVDEIGGRLGLESISDVAHKKREAFILQYLEKELYSIVEKYQKNNNYGEKTENAPIWICWWSGVENAPELVKQCVRSIIKNAGKHPVYLITEKNYGEYLSIPEYILEKVEKKQMGLAHLADYLRVCLLEKYGGLWMDATLFCSDVIPEQYFEMPFFTLKSEKRKSRYLSEFQWTTFCLGGWKGNVWFSFMREAFEQYWSKADYAIDYLFFDALIFIAKENIPAIRNLMGSVPENTPHRDDLQAAMNQDLPASMFYEIVKKDTTIYKLSWREKYNVKTKEGYPTVYQYFLGMNLGENLWEIE